MEKIIVGLGNPDEKHITTRHNSGFLILDNIAKTMDLHFVYKKRLLSEIADNKKFLLVKPQTFMNNSGLAIAKILSFYKVDKEDLIVIHDDADLSFGEYKIQYQSGSAGHHGVESIIQNLGSRDFWRVRVGIGRRTAGVLDIKNWVLTNFLPEDVEEIKKFLYKI